MRFKILFFVTLLAMAAAVSSTGQESDLLFKNLSIEDGLSQSIVTAMIQDRRGFMWFVTEDGLDRYDGYEFNVFKHDAQDPGSLVHNEIKSICEDREGILWVGSFHRGLERFDPATERFSHFHNDPDDPGSLSNDIVWAVLEDSRGRLWVGTGGGLNLLDPQTGTFTRYLHSPEDPDSISHDDVRDLCEDPDGDIWVGTAAGGLNRLDPDTGIFTRFLHDPADSKTLSHNDVRALVLDPDGKLWVGTAGGGLNRFDPSTGEFFAYRNVPDDPRSLSNDTLLALLIDESGTLWAGTDGGGLNRFDRDRGSFARYLHDNFQTATIAGNRIHSLLLDRSGLLWAGTYGNGVSRCDLKKKEFVLYRNDPNDPNSLSNNFIWSFWEEPEGILWIGTHDGGFNRLDRKTGEFTRFLHDPGDPQSLSHNSVRMVKMDRKGRVWLATNGGGLDRYDPETGLFKHYRNDPADPASLSNDTLRMVFEDSRGTIWAGTYGGGLDRWDPETDGFIHYRTVPDDPKTISNDYVRTIFEEAGGILWFGTHGGGLNRYDRSTGVFTRYRNDPEDPDSLSNDFVFCIHEDSSGTLWVATYGGGLNRFDRHTGTFTAFSKRDGLPDDVVYGILEDDIGNLWLSTNSGIARYNPRSGEVKTYTIADGLQSNEFNGGSFYENSRGEMFFGGINGFNVFDPDRILDDTFKAPVVITDLQLLNQSVPIGELPDGRTLLKRTITSTDRVELSYLDRVFSFEFAALDYATPEKNQYAYMLEGLDKEWIQLGTRRFVQFTTLPAGDYVLRVRGTNGDGFWNDEGTSLDLVVYPPWWRTTWAYLGYVLLLLAVVLGLVRFEKARERAKGRLVEAELRAQAAELQSRTTEAEAHALMLENERKTHELEEARRLQLSMLPESLPEHPRIDMAARMRTATEVGGDYYDFHVDGEGTLTVAVGDATGHGTRAGIMVAAMKALFIRLCREPDMQVFFKECDRTFAGIGKNQIFMALCLLRIQGTQARVVGAAVPPVFIYRAATGEVEVVTLRGMFLGTTFDLSFEEVAFTIGPGDKVLVLSDGYLEQFDPTSEELDYSRCTDYFKEAAGRSPKEIIDHLFRRMDEWRGDIPQGDDVTLVVLDAKA